MKKVILLLLAIAVLVTGNNPAVAQSTRGTVTGTVQDAAGAVVQGADVTLYSPSTGVS